MLFKQVHKQGNYKTGDTHRLFAELLCHASSAAAAPFTVLLLTAGAIALVVHEEPSFALKTDSSCTPVKSQDRTGTQYCLQHGSS